MAFAHRTRVPEVQPTAFGEVVSDIEPARPFLHPIGMILDLLRTNRVVGCGNSWALPPFPRSGSALECIQAN